MDKDEFMKDFTEMWLSMEDEEFKPFEFASQGVKIHISFKDKNVNWPVFQHDLEGNDEDGIDIIRLFEGMSYIILAEGANNDPCTWEYEVDYRDNQVTGHVTDYYS